MVTLIKDPIANEELRSESPQKFLIINRYTLGVLLSLKIPFYLVKPGFIRYLFSLNVTIMCGFFQPLDGNLGASLSHLTLDIEDMVSSASSN